MANEFNDIKSADFPAMFYTGVNRRVNPYAMKNDELYDMVNWWTETNAGALKARPGTTAFLNAVDANPVKGLFYVKLGGTKRLLRLSGKSIYAVDPTSASIWGTAKLTITATANWNRPDFTSLAQTNNLTSVTNLVHLVDKIAATDFHYITGDVTDTYTDQAYTTPTPIVPFKAATVQQFHGRIYAGDSYDGSIEWASLLSISSLEYSTLDTLGNTISPWSTQTTRTDLRYAYYNFIDPSYHGNIVKLTNINDALLIYKDEAVYRYNETSVMEIFGYGAFPGSISTMQDIKNDFFLTSEGFFKTDGQNTTPVGTGWYSIIKQIFQNGITASNICSGSAGFMYFCFLGNVTYDGRQVKNAMFVYNVYNDQLSLWSMNYQVTAIGYYIDANNSPVIVLGDVNGNTYFIDYSATALTDAGTPFQAEFRTKYFVFDTPKQDNQLEKVDGYTNPGSEIEMLADKNFENEYRPTIQLQGVSTTTLQDINSLGAFKTLSFKGIWNGKGPRPEFYGIIPKVIDVDERMVGIKGK